MAQMIWATPWENLIMPYANNKGADQPAHPRSLISAFIVHCLDSIILLVSISEISSLYLVSVTAQTGLSLPWSETLKTGFLATRLIFQYCSVLWLMLIRVCFKRLRWAIVQLSIFHVCTACSHFNMSHTCTYMFLKQCAFSFFQGT